MGELTALVAEHPVCESLRVKLAIALYRSGRQADALRSLDDAARVLRDELGLEPGEGIREVEDAILHQADWLRHAGPLVRTSANGGGIDDFVGRGLELEMMLGALSESMDDARFVVIDGDPGIGKTRLAEEVRRSAIGRGSTAVWGRCDERGAAPAPWPWLEIIRQLAPDDRAVDAPLADLLAGAVPLVAGQGGSIRFESFEAIATLLRADDGTPVVVLLDDIQWADATSLELLRFLTTGVDRGVLIVATTRTPSVGRHDALTDTLGAIARRHGSQRHRLGGLTTEDTAQLLKTTLPSPVSATAIRTIHGRAEGNPFYTIQLARLLGAERRPEDEVPPTVRDAVRCRLAQLLPETTDLLAVAAIIGRDFDLGLLAATQVLTLDECAQVLEPSLEERILVDHSGGVTPW